MLVIYPAVFMRRTISSIILSSISDKEAACTLADEPGHHYTPGGDIIDQTSTEHRKQELKARLRGYNRLIGLHGIVNAYEAGCQSLHETADHLSVTEKYLRDCIEAYRSKYGTCVKYGNYYIYFEPYFTVARNGI